MNHPIQLTLPGPVLYTLGKRLAKAKKRHRRRSHIVRRIFRRQTKLLRMELKR